MVVSPCPARMLEPERGGTPAPAAGISDHRTESCGTIPTITNQPFFPRYRIRQSSVLPFTDIPSLTGVYELEPECK